MRCGEDARKLSVVVDDGDCDDDGNDDVRLDSVVT